MPPEPRVDAHHHVWDLDARPQPWLDPEPMRAIRRTFDDTDLATAIDGTGVSTTVLVQVLNDADETAELLDVARGHPLIAGVVGWADLRRGDVPEQLQALRTRGPLVGIRHQLQAEPAPARWLSRADVSAGLHAVANAGLVFDLMIRPAQFDAALDVARAHPQLSFVIDHLGKPPIESGALEPWARGLRLLAGEANVSAKLSGLVTIADHHAWQVGDLRPYVDVALVAFGPSRLMFGSDWPQCLLAATYAELVGALDSLLAELTSAERREIWSTTARRVYSLG